MSRLSKRRRNLYCHASCLVALVLLVCAGCGKSEPMGTVQGKVLLNDTPYSNAAVVFTSLDTGRGGVATIQDDGTFRIETPLLVGTYKVYLEPKAIEEETERPQPTSEDRNVPAKYWDEYSSDISIDIVEGENEVTVTLEK